MEGKRYLAPDLSELFWQLESADVVSLRRVQAELVRILRERERREPADSVTVEAPSSRAYRR